MILESQLIIIENLVITFIKALFIGVAVSVPLGPVGAICVRRAVNHGRKYGFISGLGAASADVIFAIIAILGLTVILDFINNNLFILKLLASGLLIMIAIKAIKYKNNNAERKPLPFLNKITTHSQLASDYISTFILTITNPITIFSFLAIFSGFRVLKPDYNIFDMIIVLLGMFLGSIAWWFSIVQIIHYIKIKYNIGELYWINYISSVVIFISVIYILFLS
ncbi:MAG TPA: LysE family transporter [Ignavibacteriales bacterium]|nr:LysE family transporter [Ignavibacteriales bacterium]HPD66850.1 LysE family transporter [Ignavibacteriales bacterium]HRR18643.1 LysE family transporter [Ignavibacteriales bacterium]HRT98232.1 LysE family transporter [Ignavibacteriales bacterium]